jgi:cobalt/nickel transport system ATP-binding protein
MKAIEIINVSYRYQDGLNALKDISFDVDEGEKIAVIGPNGAGKSTLILHLNGLISDSGEIRIFGEKIEKKSIKKIRQSVGLLFQNPDDQLFCPTVFDDVAFGPRNLSLPENEIKKLVNESLTKVGLTEFGKRSSYHLSIGEKRRVAIATVISMNAKILAFDEPSSNLDPRGRREFIELIKSIPLTQVLVTHDLEIVRNVCSKVVLMDKGRIVKIGNTNEILSDKDLLNRHGMT